MVTNENETHRIIFPAWACHALSIKMYMYISMDDNGVAVKGHRITHKMRFLTFYYKTKEETQRKRTCDENKVDRP